jgi:hypothetical protein
MYEQGDREESKDTEQLDARTVAHNHNQDIRYLMSNDQYGQYYIALSSKSVRDLRL